MERKKKGKKITAVALTAALIAALICCVGCQSGNAAPDPTKTTGTTAATTEATGEETTEGGEPISDPSDGEEHVHEYTEEVVEATCVERGYTTHTCSCGDEYVDNYTNAVGHSWGSWVVTKAATESATGLEERVCGGCNATETRDVPKVIPNHTHKYTSKETKKATCTSDGVVTYTCSCGESYTESVAKTGHKYVDTVTKPTCTQDGYTTSKCSVCGNTKTTAGAKATGHSYKSVVTAPTYTAGGYTTYSCNACGHSYKGNYTAKLEPKPTEPAPTEPKPTDPKPTEPPHSHSYSSSVTTAPTCTSAGIRTYVCSCGHSYTESITASHNWVHHHTDEVGHEEYYLVCHCGGWSCPTTGNWTSSWSAHKTQVKEETGTTAGHSYYETSRWVTDTPASDYYKCSVCGATK